ncbi:MAG: hypothetical protein HGA44_14125 [Cellulomonadaceae bacterium]|nr:hypothetical protein [Cellulomonadaceae bacterium]
MVSDPALAMLRDQRWIWKSVAIVISIVTVSSGCSGELEDGTAAEPLAGSTAQATGAQSALAPSTTLPLARDLPFHAYAAAVNTIVTGPLDDADAAKSRYDTIAEATAECMKEAGFEYTVTPYEKPTAVVLPWTQNSLHLPVLPSDRADVERSGYGQDDVGAMEAQLEATQHLDANSAYLDGLSSSAQAEYVYALSGEHGPNDPDGDPAGGCAGRAESAAAVPAAPQDSVGAQFAPLIRAMGQLADSGLAEDPRTAALNDEWNSCMLDAGYDVAPPPEFEAREGTPGPLYAYTLAVLTPPSGEAQWPGADVPADEIPIERQSLVGSDAEHTIALADFDCRSSTDYVERLTDILESLEDAFVSSHQTELASLEAAASTL